MNTYVTYFFGDFWHFAGLMLLVWSIAMLISNLWANLCKTIVLCIRRQSDNNKPTDTDGSTNE